MSLDSKNILFQLSGSIACYKAADAISQLTQLGHDVQCVTTASALKFIGKATLEGLTGRPVLSDLFQPGEMIGHIQWARWADLMVLCPASAHSINKLSAGLADDLIGCLFLARQSHIPYLLFPAMNPEMLNHPSVKQSLSQLKHWGVDVMETGQGTLACKEQGYGRLLEPEQIVSLIKNKLTKTQPRLNRKVLITSGGTRESIDGVRFISNFSTGRTGSVLAQHFHQSGYEVTYLHGVDAVIPTHSHKNIEFSSFKDLDQKIQHQLSSQHYDVVLHLAAVSDFSIDSIEQGPLTITPSQTSKLNSDQDLKINLKRNHKIVCGLRDYSMNKKIKVIAFKLTQGANSGERVKAVERLISSAKIDLVVHNDFNDIKDGEHYFNVFKDLKLLKTLKGKALLAQYLLNDLNTGPKDSFSQEVQL